MRPPDLYEVVCELSPTEMWYHLRFVPMQEAAAAQKRAAAEKLYSPPASRGESRGCGGARLTRRNVRPRERNLSGLKHK